MPTCRPRDASTTDATACPSGQQKCGSTCTNTTFDPSNCGACGTACTGGQVCSAGACKTECASGQTACTTDGGGFCTNTSDDGQNCGSCGNACGAGQVCSGGTCATTCVPSETLCRGDGGAYCANTKTDDGNCGACGTTCPAGDVCANGACSTTCGATDTLCAPDGGAPYCANTETDNANCGVCGTTCPAGYVCANGVCSTTCGATETLCAPDGGAPYCANTQTDNANCGVCGTTCPAGNVCANGVCSTTCGTTETLCAPDGGAPYCANTETDNANCGVCGTACPSGDACSAGTCVPGCLSGQSLCGGDGGAPYCSNLQGDVNNCGACGKVCGVDQTCVSGICQASILTIGPVAISGALTTCTTNQSNAGRKIAIDPATNEIEVGMICAGTAYFTRSVNGGISYSPPIQVGLTAVGELAVAAGPPGVVYAVANEGGNIVFVHSSDGGQTWSAPAKIDTGADPGFGVSMATYRNSVYVEVPHPAATAVDVLTNTADGVGAFTTTSVPLVVFPNDVLVDQSNGNVWVAGDSTPFALKMSSDGATTFGAVANPVNPGGSFSDWALGNGTIFALTGTPDDLAMIQTVTPGTAVATTGLAATNSTQGHAVASDMAGNAYVVGNTATGVVLERVLHGTTAVATTRNLGTGTSPVVAATGTNLAAVAFTNGTAVYATVQQF